MLCRPGDDLLSRVLRQSTIGAEAFDGRVRDGIGSCRLAESHQAGKERIVEAKWALGEQRQSAVGNRGCAIRIAEARLPLQAFRV